MLMSMWIGVAMGPELRDRNKVEGLPLMTWLTACHCVPPQVPVQQRPLPAAGFLRAAPVTEHAQCGRLGKHASEELWGEAESAGWGDPVTFVTHQAPPTNTAPLLEGNDPLAHQSGGIAQVPVRIFCNLFGKFCVSDTQKRMPNKCVLIKPGRRFNTRVLTSQLKKHH